MSIATLVSVFRRHDFEESRSVMEASSSQSFVRRLVVLGGGEISRGQMRIWPVMDGAFSRPILNEMFSPSEADWMKYWPLPGFIE